MPRLAMAATRAGCWNSCRAAAISMHLMWIRSRSSGQKNGWSGPDMVRRSWRSCRKTLPILTGSRRSTDRLILSSRIWACHPCRSMIRAGVFLTRWRDRLICGWIPDRGYLRQSAWKNWHRTSWQECS